MHHPDYPETYRYDPRSINFNEGGFRFYRTTREAWGTSWIIPKRSHDWAWMVGSLIIVAALAYGMYFWR